MDRKLTPLELQLQQYAPEMFALHILMKDSIAGGGGEKKLSMLINTLLQYNQTKATGAITIDFSKGYIAAIDTRVRITAHTGV